MAYGDVVRHFEGGGIRMREISLGGRKIRTEWLYTCCVCDTEEWVKVVNDWGQSKISFLGIKYCPVHAYLAKEMDKTLRQTFKAEAKEIVRQVADRISRKSA